MKQIVPILWYVLALLVMLGFLGFVANAVMRSGHPGFALAQLFPTLLSIATLIATGLAYHLMARATDSIAISVIGLIQWIFALLAQAGYFAGRALQNQSMIGGDSAVGLDTVAIVFGVAAITSLIAGVLFIIALIIAINSTPNRETYPLS